MSRSYDYRADMLAAHEPKPTVKPKRKLAEIQRRNLRWVAMLREIASLGLHAAEASRLTGISSGHVCILARKHGIVFSRVVPETGLRRAIRKGYAEGKSPRQIASEVGASYETVKVLASKMKITVRDPSRFRRGFEIPADRRTEYRSLIRLGCTPQEAGIEMRLIPRPPLAPRPDPRYSGGRPEARP